MPRVLTSGMRRRAGGALRTWNGFIASLPWWLSTFTAMRPDFGRVIATEDATRVGRRWRGHAVPLRVPAVPIDIQEKVLPAALPAVDRLMDSCPPVPAPTPLPLDSAPIVSA